MPLPSDQTQPEQLSVDDFAAKLKERDPRLASVPNDVLVRGALERRPELIQFLQTSESRADRPSLLPFYERVGQRIEQNIKLPVQMLDYALHPGNPNYPPPAAPNVPAAPHTPIEAATYGVRAGYGMLKDLYEQYKTDPARLVGDVVMLAPELAEMKLPGSRVAKVATKTIEAVPEHLRALTPEQRAEYTASLDKANAAHAADMSDYAAKEAAARKQWVEKAYGAKKSVADAEAQVARKDVLTRASNEYVKSAQENLQNTHALVRADLDARWQDLRQQMQGATVNSVDLYNAVKEAESKYLKGSPASIKQFGDLVREMGVEVNDAGEIVMRDGIDGQLPFDTARVHYSAIGDKLASGNLPGNVYQALKSVSTSLDEMMHAQTEAVGLGDTYIKLKRDWSQYMSDWKDTSSLSKGGSPVAHALAATDPAFVSTQIMGKAGDRYMQTLSRYRKFGARPYLAAAARRLANEADAIPAKPKLAIPPGKYKPPVPPELKEVPVPEPEVTPVSGKAPKGVRRAARILGGVAGVPAGSALGHPVMGFFAGEEAGGAAADYVYRKRAARAARAGVPPGMIPPGQE